MKIAVFSTPTGPRSGVVLGQSVLDLEVLIADGGQVRDVADLLQRDDEVIHRLRDRVGEIVRSGDVPEGALALASLTLLPPVLRPPTIRDHIAFEEHASRQFTRELAEVWRRRPIHYYSNTSRLVGHGGDVRLPETERLDYELELAVVVRDECSDLAEEEALDHVFGFMIMNDWSARDLQADEMAYGLGPAKGKDFATSLGPWLVTVDEMAPYLANGVLDVACRVSVNGKTWAADSSGGEQAHTWGAMLAHASQDSTLLPGDVLASGTVGGCSIGEAIRKGYPARYLKAGDLVELEVEGLGKLANTVVASPSIPGVRKYRAATLPPMPVPLPSATTT